MSDYSIGFTAASVTYQCNDGFVPSDAMSAACSVSGAWNPPPEQHRCFPSTGKCILNGFGKILPLFVARVILERLRPPGTPLCSEDNMFLSYNCSVWTNSEDLQLMWQVTFPGSMPINITYNSNSDLGTLDSHNHSIITTLNRYENGTYAESLIHLTASTSQPSLECSSPGLDEVVTVVTGGTLFLICFLC